MAKLYLGNREITPSIYTNGSGSGEKFGITIDTILGDVDTNGVLQSPTGPNDLIFTGVKDVGDSALQTAFATSHIRSVSFPDLEHLNNNRSLYSAFTSCSTMTSCLFPKLSTISGSYAFSNTFSNNSNLTSVSLPELTLITGNNSFSNAFSGCINLTSVSFPKLSVITGDSACYGLTSACHKLTDAYFPALTTASFGTRTNQFNYLIAYASSSVIHTFHFPSNLESTIQGLTGYPLFGGTSGSVVLSFDLPATS